MDSKILILLWALCGWTAASPLKYRQFQQPDVKYDEGGQKIIVTESGTWKVSERPKPKPGFYLNKQFQTKKEAKIELEDKTPRVIVTNSGIWKVAQHPQPDPAIKLNRVFPKTAAQNEPQHETITGKDGRVWEISKPSDLVGVKYQKPQTEDKLAFPTNNNPIVRMVLKKRLLGEPPVVTSVTEAPSMWRPYGVSFGHTAKVETKAEGQLHNAASTTKSSNINVISSNRYNLMQLFQQLGDSINIRESKTPTTRPPAQKSYLRATTSAFQQPSIQTRKTSTVKAEQQQQNTTPNYQVGNDGVFSCEGREYGYYADIQSGCQNYHVCNPVDLGSGNIQYYKYDFKCGGGSKWDQGQMACVAASMVACQ